jgi:outer membrane protein TolC
MQVNHITAWQARHAAKVGDITALPEDEQAAALAKLERQGDLAAARLDRARAQLEKKTGKPVEESPVIGGENPATEGFDDSPAASGNDKGPKAEKSKGHGHQKGNQGQGNGKKGR